MVFTFERQFPSPRQSTSGSSRTGLGGQLQLDLLFRHSPPSACSEILVGPSPLRRSRVETESAPVHYQGEAPQSRAHLRGRMRGEGVVLTREPAPFSPGTTVPYHPVRIWTDEGGTKRPLPLWQRQEIQKMPPCSASGAYASRFNRAPSPCITPKPFEASRGTI